MALFNQVVKLFNKPDPSQPEEGGPRVPFWESPERTGWLMKQGAHIKTWCGARSLPLPPLSPPGPRLDSSASQQTLSAHANVSLLPPPCAGAAAGSS